MPRSKLNEDGSIDASFIAGIEEAKEKLALFLERLHDDPDIEGDLTLNLVQVGHGSTAPIFSWTWSQSDEVVAMTDTIVDKAVEDGGALGSGKCKYAVTVDGRKSRCAFAIDFPDSDDDDPDEPPTDKGEKALIMRHSQGLMKMVKDMFEQTTKMQARQISEMREEIHSYRRSEVEHIRLFTETIDRNAERKIEAKRLEKSEERKDAVVSMLSNVGMPLLMSKLMGASAPGASTPLETMLTGFLNTFQKEQLDQVLQTGTIQLNQDQMFSFLHILEAFVRRKESEGQAAAQSGDAAHQGGQANGAPTPTPQQGT